MQLSDFGFGEWKQQYDFRKWCLLTLPTNSHNTNVNVYLQTRALISGHLALQDPQFKQDFQEYIRPWNLQRQDLPREDYNRHFLHLWQKVQQKLGYLKGDLGFLYYIQHSPRLIQQWLAWPQQLFWAITLRPILWTPLSPTPARHRISSASNLTELFQMAIQEAIGFYAESNETGPIHQIAELGLEIAEQIFTPDVLTSPVQFDAITKKKTKDRHHPRWRYMIEGIAGDHKSIPLENFFLKGEEWSQKEDKSESKENIRWFQKKVKRLKDLGKEHLRKTLHETFPEDLYEIGDPVLLASFNQQSVTQFIHGDSDLHTPYLSVLIVLDRNHHPPTQVLSHQNWFHVLKSPQFQLYLRQHLNTLPQDATGKLTEQEVLRWLKTHLMFPRMNAPVIPSRASNFADVIVFDGYLQHYGVPPSNDRPRYRLFWPFVPLKSQKDLVVDFQLTPWVLAGWLYGQYSKEALVEFLQWKEHIPLLTIQKRIEAVTAYTDQQSRYAGQQSVRGQQLQRLLKQFVDSLPPL